jgi:hypothetical protein
MDEKITASNHSNRLNDDIRTEFDKIKWMISEHTRVQDKKIKFRDELVELLTNQVVDLTMMSKIELGDDVIKEIKRLKNIINEQNNLLFNFTPTSRNYTRVHIIFLYSK